MYLQKRYFLYTLFTISKKPHNITQKPCKLLLGVFFSAKDPQIFPFSAISFCVLDMSEMRFCDLGLLH